MIGVDIKIDLSEFSTGLTYIFGKSQVLFTFGVDRIIRVLSSLQRVVVMQPGQDWIVTDWSNDIPVMDGCTLNVKQLLDEEEICY